MRAARLLQILLILQNRGRTTAPVLAAELEVTPRTILRDVDAMTEAGLPILVTQGNRGGIELGFNYRTRLTGLATDEAEALALWLANPPAALDDLGMLRPAIRARAKLIESFPTKVRETFAQTAARFAFTHPVANPPDPRIEALAKAIRSGDRVRLRARSQDGISLTPTALHHDSQGWHLIAGPLVVPMDQWDDINISRA